MKAKVIEIQVGGTSNCDSLQTACDLFLFGISLRSKINFAIELPNGEIKSITIRDEDDETIAYGDFEGLPSFLDYCEEVKDATD